MGRKFPVWVRMSVLADINTSNCRSLDFLLSPAEDVGTIALHERQGRCTVRIGPSVIAYVAVLVTMVPLAALASDRVVVPIQQQVNPGGRNYFVSVTIEGSSVNLVLDSGSDGIQVLQTAVPNAKAYPGEKTQEYDSGVRLHSVMGVAKVGFGTLVQSATMALVQTVDCDPAITYPTCLAAKGQPSVLWHGLQGVLGINLEAKGTNVPISNPLNGIADAWIIELPEPGDKGPGSLILNPNDADLRGFTKYAAGQGGNAGAARDNPIPGCITNKTSGAKYCGPIIPDTGKSDVYVITDTLKAERNWALGSVVELKLGDSSENTVVGKWTEQLAIYPTLVVEGPFSQLRNQPATRVLAGQEPFLLFDVLYDAVHEQIGLRAR